MRNTLITITFSLLAAGCSGYGGDWPKLNDPLPDPSERMRVQATPDIKVTPQSPIESDALDFAAHKERKNAITQEIAAAWQVFEDTLKSIDAENDAEDRLIAWSGAQLALSRVSAEVNKLRDLADIPILPPSNESKAYMESISASLALYDQRLTDAKESVKAKQ